MHFSFLNKRFFTYIVFFAFLGLCEPTFGEYDFDKKRVLNLVNKKDKELFLPITFNYFIGELIANLDEQEVKRGQKNLSVDIDSDKQSQINSNFIADGNVIVRANNAVLRADKLSYDSESKKLIINGNIKFKSRNQYFIAEYISFDFTQNKGFISEIYGSVDFDGLGNIDLNKKGEKILNENFANDLKIKKVKLNNSSGFKLNNLFKKNKEDESLLQKISNQSVQSNFKEINNTRFFTKRINIHENIWSSDIMLLTSDPFNKPQIKIKNKDFKIIFDEQISKINTKWSNLILDDKLTIPLGPRRINLDDEQNARWGLGYDKKKYDGIYAYRNSNTIYFDERKKSILDFKTIFLIQRAIEGTSKSYPNKNKSVLSPKIKQDIKFADYFGLSTSFLTDISKWKYVLDVETNSLDFEKLNNGVEAQTFLTRNIFSNFERNSFKTGDITFFGTFREKTKNGSLGEIVVNSSYGGRFDLSTNNGKNRSSKLALSYGTYESSSRLDSNLLINKNRLNIFLKNNIRYPLWKPRVKKYINKKYVYSPRIIQKGLFFDVETNFDFFRYSDGLKQDMFLIKAGPKLIYGDFKKKFFDFTELSVYPRFKFNRGESPFSFDQIVDTKVLEVSAKQQVYGPLTIKLSSEINLDEDVDSENKYINTTANLGFNRRAYNVNLFYNFDTEVGGLSFNINSFSFEGLGEKFR